MTREAAAYIEAIANGTIPTTGSEEHSAYTAWSEESAKVSGTWVEFQMMRIQSEVRLEEMYDEVEKTFA